MIRVQRFARSISLSWPHGVRQKGRKNRRGGIYPRLRFTPQNSLKQCCNETYEVSLVAWYLNCTLKKAQASLGHLTRPQLLVLAQRFRSSSFIAEAKKYRSATAKGTSYPKSANQQDVPSKPFPSKMPRVDRCDTPSTKSMTRIECTALRVMQRSSPESSHATQELRREFGRNS